MTSILAPSLPEPPAPWSFPLVATAAPMIMGLAMWAVTRSPLSLLFAGLGPLIAIGSLIDARFQAKRKARAESARFNAELATARSELDAAHRAERAALIARFPPVGSLGAVWNGSTEVRLGTAAIASDVRLDGVNPRARQLDDLATSARTLEGAPAVVDLRLGIAIVDTGPGAAALARSVIVQLAARLPPDYWRVAVDGGESWLAALPHSTVAGATGFVSEGAAVRVALVSHAREAPSDVGCIVDGNAAVLSDGERLELHSLERLSAAQAAHLADRLATRARAEGRIPEVSTLAALVPFGSLAQRAAAGLTATIGVDVAGPTMIDLVAAGPHAIIGGTTGSGKSELLITWALAMAVTNSPSRLNLLLVDFKGGASFAGLGTLPHCVGVLTDLDTAGAQRALESLGAEIRHRERTLAAAGARSIADLDRNTAPELARLVIVVDEFAAVARVLPELHELFADLAARGRSLGLHLILCTQQPAAVVRDAVFANVSVRVSLRVHSATDSVAVVGTPAAAELSAAARGRAILSLDGEAPREVQLALATPADIGAVASAWPTESGSQELRRPWRDPLPRFIPLESLEPHECAEGPCVRLGVSDLPSEQSQPLAVWHPRVHGHLLVVGAARSGASTALATLAAAGGVRVARDPDVAWDTLAHYAARVREGVALNEVLLIDDLDSIVDALGHDHSAELVDNLAVILRSGAALGLYVAIATQRLSGQLHALAGLCSARLVLRVADRHEHALAGGATRFDPRLPPGGGEWLGARVQVAYTERVPVDDLITPAHFEPPPVFAVVSSRPVAVAAIFAESCRVVGPAPNAELSITTGGLPTAMIGDVSAWQEHWGAIARLRATVPIVFDGCSVAEFRTLTQLRALPPPVSRADGTVVLLEPSGRVSRARLEPRHPHR